MGEELSGVRGDALRKSADLSRSPHHLATRTEVHDLGEVFSAAVLNSFLEVWVKRLFPYGNRGVRALDRAHVVDEGATAADHLLTMIIRALDYTPPVDMQFGDFLSALLTADQEVHPDDSRYGYREVLTGVFAEYGILPSATSWGSKTGQWLPPESEVSYGGTSHEEMGRDPEAAFRFVWQNRDELRLDPDAYTYVESVRPTVRTATCVLVLATLLLLPSSALAHGGGLDSYGGHNDRKAGTYHFHRGPLAGRSYPSKAAALRALEAATAPKPQPVAPADSDEPSPAEVIKNATTAKKVDALIALLVKKGLIGEAELAAQIQAGP